MADRWKRSAIILMIHALFSNAATAPCRRSFASLAMASSRAFPTMPSIACGSAISTVSLIAADMWWTRSGEMFAHLLIGVRVNLTTCIALLEYLECRWSRLWCPCRRWERCGRFSIEPAHNRPDDDHEEINPQDRTKRHQKPAPTKTIAPHHCF